MLNNIYIYNINIYLFQIYLIYSDEISKKFLNSMIQIEKIFI